MDATKHLKLNSDQTISKLDKVANEINVYFKSASGKPIRCETMKHGDGWDILHAIMKQNNMTMQQIDAFNPSIYANKVSFKWHVA